MRELRWMLAAWLVSSPAVAQGAETADAPRAIEDESGWFAQGPPEDALAPSPAEAPAPAPLPAAVVTPAATHETAPRVVLPPGQQAVVEARCGRRTGDPIVIACAGGAPPEHDAEPEPREPARKWYGWQTLIVDLSLMEVLLASLVTAHDPERASAIYLGGTALAPPAIHLANRQPGKAGISLAIRGGGMLTLYSLLSDGGSHWEEDYTSLLAVFTLFLIHPAATALDAALFARKPISGTRQARRGPHLVGLGPMLLPGEGERRTSRMLPGGFVSAAF